MPKQNRFSAMADVLKGEQLPEQELAIPAPEPSPAISTPGKRGRPTGKRSNPDFTQVGAYVPKTLKKRVDRILIDEEIDFSDLVTQLLQEWVNGKAGK